MGLKDSRDALENIKISSAWNQTPDQTTAWSLCQLGYSGSLFVSTLRTIFFTLIMPYIPPQVYTLQQAIIHTYIHMIFHFHQSSDHTGMGYEACLKNKSE